ncbi:hypothetical protein R3P38DRAFT_2561824 [Favolaschia claudopus]|uniref:ABA 3 protein n=1 Tax=Favolaschia claudopus TaxID=2862362 RepID=A0AAW0A2Q2_9AGAR
MPTATHLDARDSWYFPAEVAGELKDVPVSDEVRKEIFACSWEYSRSVIPQYTNLTRYMAFFRIIVIGVTIEFLGSLADVVANKDIILGYSLPELLTTIFGSTPRYRDMELEFRAFLLTTSHKTSNLRDTEFFRRYVNALAYSPAQWFRMRDCDALVRFTVAAALAVNDLDHVWFSDAQWEMISEMSITMYDAVAFYKHRSEGETHSTFAYAPEELRQAGFKQCREMLWALDVGWNGPCQITNLRPVANFIRSFSGPIHISMRRYRFVEDSLTIGKPETQEVIDQTRANFKLWHRVDANTGKVTDEEDVQRYKDILARSEELLFPGLDRFLESTGHGACKDCFYRESYGAETPYQFGGVKLCDTCKNKWPTHFETFSERMLRVFPELEDVM